MQFKDRHFYKFLQFNSIGNAVLWWSFKRLKVFFFCALQSSVTCIIIRVSMHYAVFCVFKSHISLALNSKQQALCTQRLDFSTLNGANSEPVSCNCCSWCCLWLINELVDQREDLRSHWKFWPISLLYPPKEHNSDKNTPGENKNNKKSCCCNCHCVQSQNSESD